LRENFGGKEVNRMKREKRTFLGLGLIQLFVSIAAIPSGIILILDPTGHKLGLPVQLLDYSPFGDYLVPGLILFAVHGFAGLIGALLSLSKRKYAGNLGIILGLALMIWIAAQVYWIGPVSWLQPLMFLLGVAEVLLSIRIRPITFIITQ
jgi:hypothetical protein